MSKLLISALLLFTSCAPTTTIIDQLQVSTPRSAVCTVGSTGTPINGLSLPPSFSGAGGHDHVAALDDALKKVGFRTHLDAIDHVDIYIWGMVADWENLNGDSLGRIGDVDLTITDNHSGLPLLAIYQRAAKFLPQAPTEEKFTEQLMQVLLSKFCQKV